jgi:hypothetical protein
MGNFKELRFDRDNELRHGNSKNTNIIKIHSDKTITIAVNTRQI